MGGSTESTCTIHNAPHLTAGVSSCTMNSSLQLAVSDGTPVEMEEAHPVWSETQNKAFFFISNTSEDKRGQLIKTDVTEASGQQDSNSL